MQQFDTNIYWSCDRYANRDMIDQNTNLRLLSRVVEPNRFMHGVYQIEYDFYDEGGLTVDVKLVDILWSWGNNTGRDSG